MYSWANGQTIEIQRLSSLISQYIRLDWFLFDRVPHNRSQAIFFWRLVAKGYGRIFIGDLATYRWSELSFNIFEAPH